MPDKPYTEMDHEELAHAADPLNRIVTKDYPILGYVPTDEQVEEAKAKLVILNDAARALNDLGPVHHAAAMGPEGKLLQEDEVKVLIQHRLNRRIEQVASDAE